MVSFLHFFFGIWYQAGTEDNDKDFIQIVEHKEKDEDWLLSPPKISVDAKNLAENSTLREIRYIHGETSLYF